MFDERFQKGDYYLELECDRGGSGRNECEGRKEKQTGCSRPVCL
ncbi:hypothetical protein [Bacillus thuringiensis]|nr:hypothetical protein [Bacillus thuringiensis]